MTAVLYSRFGSVVVVATVAVPVLPRVEPVVSWGYCLDDIKRRERRSDKPVELNQSFLVLGVPPMMVIQAFGAEAYLLRRPMPGKKSSTPVLYWWVVKGPLVGNDLSASKYHDAKQLVPYGAFHVLVVVTVCTPTFVAPYPPDLKQC